MMADNEWTDNHEIKQYCYDVRHILLTDGQWSRILVISFKTILISGHDIKKLSSYF